MKNYKLHISDGFKDIYGTEMLIKKELENRVLNVFNSYGYELIKTPGLEYMDVYTLGKGQKPELYTLINRQGEVLSLRSDMTSSVARFVSTNKKLKAGVKKYCYSADTYRYPRLYQGKNHQFLQAGVELIGDDSIEADITTIYLASTVLKKCNINNFTINLGSSLFLKTLFDDFKFSDEIQKNIIEAIEHKDYVLLSQYLNSNVDREKAEFITELMMRGGKLKYIDKQMNVLKDTKAYDVLKYLKNIYLTLNELGVDNIIFDFSIFSYQEYYTGIIFKIYIDSVTKEVVYGGRCDKLFKEYGEDTPNVGFGMDLDLITDYVYKNDLIDVKTKKYLSYQKEFFTKALLNNEELRKDNIIVSHVNNLDNFDMALNYAKDHKFDYIVLYNENGYELKEVK
ncbi:MAG: ATP phosphoribosyltransferase regulatory subunit [Acholeplasmatales bacterium]|nr:ATP phosphoribosyltransferase regulatory subunit [Acholeplasmatales bacterium]